MSVPFSVAKAAYGQTQQLTSNKDGLFNPLGKSGGENTPDFGQLVADSMQSVADAGKKSDALSADLVNGKANIVDVVTAVSQTELAMNSLVSVRDRVISAYEEIMRMPI